MLSKHTKENSIEFLKRYKGLFEFNNFSKIFEHDFKMYLVELENDNTALARSIKKCRDRANTGSLKDREALKGFIKARLLKGFNLYEIEEGKISRKPVYENLILNIRDEIVDWIVPFGNNKKISTEDKFKMILIKSREINVLGYDEAFNRIKGRYPIYNKEERVGDFTNKSCEYNKEDIELIYVSEVEEVTFNDKIEFIVQSLFEEIYGLRNIDMLCYSAVNEVGFQNDGEYVYVWCDEKIRLKFLSLTSKQAEVVQRRILTKAGQLDTSTQEVMWNRVDNARITATMPPYTSNRVLRVRIFNIVDKNFDVIIQDDKLSFLIKTLVKIGLTISLQGELGSGKSTTMSTLLEILDDSIHIATIEDVLEQHNSKKYPNKSIVELQSTSEKSLMDSLSTLLRLSVDAANVGEVRDGESLAVLIQIAQAIGKSVFFTSHMASAEDFVPRGKNMLISTGRYFTEQAAVFDLVNYVNIILQHKIGERGRYIAPVVEIVPLVSKYARYEATMDSSIEELQKLSYIEKIQQTPSNMYKLNTLIDLENGEYRYKNFPSEQLVERALSNELTRKYMLRLISKMEMDLGIYKGGILNGPQEK